MTSLVILLIAVALVAFGGLFAAADSAMQTLSRSDILELATRSRAKRSLIAIAEDTGAHVNGVSFARVVSETTAAVLVTIYLAFAIDELWIALLLAVLIMTAVSFVLVGSSPRSVGRAHPRVVLALSAFPIHALRVVLGPVAGALVRLGDRVTPGRPRTATFTSEEQLLSMVDVATELDVLEEDDRALIHSIIEFNDTVVREVMIPRTDMVTISQGDTLAQAFGLFLARGISRIPVVADDVDEIIGIIYLRDVAKVNFEQPSQLDVSIVDDLAKPALFVPESKKVDDTLRDMQLQSNHLAMVVDEYGGIAGLVTLEDLIEELVGDISDEYDREASEFEKLDDDTYRVSARIAVDELGELFGLDLDDDDVDTAGGLLSKELGRIPEVGSTVTVHGIELTAERTEGRRKRISTIVVRRAEQSLEVHPELGSVSNDEHKGAK